MKKKSNNMWSQSHYRVMTMLTKFNLNNIVIKMSSDLYQNEYSCHGMKTLESKYLTFMLVNQLKMIGRNQKHLEIQLVKRT